MGLYINPPDMTKEDWLNKHAKRVPNNRPVIPADKTLVLVCFVHNGMFTAAAVCDTQHEMEAFNQPHDERPKMWLVVPRVELQKLPGLENV